MNDKVPPDEPLATRTEAEGATVDLPEGLGFFTTGQVLGDRYEILEMLGRGGMGEVWRAFDLKLRVEVGLKALREELFQSEGRREMLRQEVRAAREVMSPNVCRIFDLHEFEGRELVSMEYVDGATLLRVLQERGPLELKEAQDIASQFLAGLEAIHKAGLVHRDVKPENIMLTRAGRVVVMDFGLARGPESGAGSVSGTPAYMAPEHAAGGDVDARADVYSAGVVLAEMVSPEGIKSYESRQSVWEGVRSEPAQVPDSPWAPVIQRAVARDRERRQNSAHTLIRELEDVTLRVEGAEDLHPYPGLASFTEDDAEFFFGREAEVEAMWRRIEGPPRMLALVGPSGAGKTSFLQAGLLAHAGPGWTCVRCKPGNNPQLALGRALAQSLAGDTEATELMLRFDNPEVATEVAGLWGDQAPNALLVVDQFEELFTQCGIDEQRRFAEQLTSIVLNADVHVLLSMRDDFLLRCHDHEAFSPVFADLTPIRAPAGGALRRALVQPGAKCGYRFEDDELVEEILAEVEGERGALPLLAFALARLWENRDRETGLLTRQAYHNIGGVAGALARHAEATVDRIGVERIPIVRELFRNLVTAEGTRAVREWDELLSVFGIDTQPKPKTPDRQARMLAATNSEAIVAASFQLASPLADRGAAEEVLAELIDSRLLTSYEVREDEHEPIRRVEIIHESLLANWPRLVRWQTQDQEGAQLRDELRQSARAWDEHGRHDDRLWTGTAYREYRLWRERYPGGLTEVEEAFGSAMTLLAGRNMRRRRMLAAVGVSILIVVLAVVTGLWRRSVVNERLAESHKLAAMGQIALEDYPTKALAFATRSLELADNDEARILALRALWKGPTAFVVNDVSSNDGSFSPDGAWLAQSPYFSKSGIRLISSDGRQQTLDATEAAPTSSVVALFGGRKNLFVTMGLGDKRDIGLWSAPEGRVLARAHLEEQPDGYPWLALGIDAAAPRSRGLFATENDNLVTVHALYPDGGHQLLGSVDFTGPTGFVCSPRSSGEWFGVVDGNDVSIARVSEDALSTPEPLGRHEGELLDSCSADPLGRHFVTLNRAGEIKLWDVSGQSNHETMRGPRNPLNTQFPWFSRDGSHLLVWSSSDGEFGELWIWSVGDPPPRLVRRLDRIEFDRGVSVGRAGPWLAMAGPLPNHRIWSLSWPDGADPIVLRHGPVLNIISTPTFSPDGRWLATTDAGGLTMWPLNRRYPAVLRHEFRHFGGGLEFGPQGRFLVSAAGRTASLFPLEGLVPAPARTLLDVPSRLSEFSLSPDGELFAASEMQGGLWIGRVDGQAPREVAADTFRVEFDPEGRRLALSEGRVLSLDDIPDSPSSGPTSVSPLDVPVTERLDGPFGYVFVFSSDGRLMTGTTTGLVAWDLETGRHETLVERDSSIFAASADGRRVLVLDASGEGYMTQDPLWPPEYFDFDTGTTTTLSTHGPRVWSLAMDREGTIAVTGDRNGVVRVGPVTGEEPHLLLGHDEGDIFYVAVDPSGRWIASTSQDGTARLWPMPDLSKPPLHTLPRSELIAKLKTLTNLRAVRDEESTTGWRIEVGPFPGWETVPTW